MSKDLIIDVSPSEIVLALLEDKQLVELNKEQSNTRYSVGDIYLGKVKKIMHGLNAVFVDIGSDKDAFLHYLDLGAQFSSLNRFVQLNISLKRNIPPFQKFRLEPEINKNGKISKLLSVGQYILVQIAKEPISTKGPRLSSEISIAGRNLVLIPFSNKVYVSTKIKLAAERDRLKNLIQSIKPNNYGVIIRTISENKKVAELDSELQELVEKWENGFEKIRNPNGPLLFMGEMNRTTAFIRDLLSPSFSSICVNDDNVFYEIKNYIKNIAQGQEKIVKLYDNKEPIFDFYNVDKQIKGLFGNIVPLKKGAYIVIEHTEALHVIDVNSGTRSKAGANQETNALEVNTIAAEEIARQLRLRDMGGIIVIDFIDMHNSAYKQQLYDKMKKIMSTDRAKHNILPLSRFGLMQITRQRVRPEMNIETLESCPTCKGTGKIVPSILFIDELDNNVKYVFNKLQKKRVKLIVHPFIEAYLKSGIFSKRFKWWLKYKRCLKVRSNKNYTLLEYNFFDKKGAKI